jgi:hypothetical protein
VNWRKFRGTSTTKNHIIASDDYRTCWREPKETIISPIKTIRPLKGAGKIKLTWPSSADVNVWAREKAY